MRAFLILPLCFISIILNAQDTIYKRNGDIVSAKVMEVNVKDISYKRTDLLDGPLFIINKTELKKIKYLTGAVDSFAMVKPHLQTQAVVLQQQLQYGFPERSEKITTSYKRGIYQYRGQRFSDNNVLFLAQQKNQTWKSKDLDLAIKDCHRNKMFQYYVGFGGLIVGGATLITGAAISGSAIDESGVGGALVAVLAVGIVVSAEIVSFHYKLKRHKKADMVVELYNNLAEK